MADHRNTNQTPQQDTNHNSIQQNTSQTPSHNPTPIRPLSTRRYITDANKLRSFCTARVANDHNADTNYQACLNMYHNDKVNQDFKNCLNGVRPWECAFFYIFVAKKYGEMPDIKSLD
jgi:hypothetical protein